MSALSKVTATMRKLDNEVVPIIHHRGGVKQLDYETFMRTTRIRNVLEEAKKELERLPDQKVNT